MPLLTLRRCSPLIAMLVLLQACGGSGAPTVQNSTPPPPTLSIDVQRVFPQLSFSSPVGLLQAPGDTSRWFVIEQHGVIQVFDNLVNVASSDDYLDIVARVDSTPGEGGLLGMAFHPDFQNNGEIFVSYTRGGPLESVISRFTLDPGTGNPDPNSESIILTALQPAGNHNGGHIAFGPAGNLYIGFGDGGGAGDPGENGQDTSNYLGAMVRVNVDSASPYGIPSDNPFATFTNCMAGFGLLLPCPEIYAWGFRNPWRFSFDSQSGELWVGDVGQNSWEEINRVELGLNYGWDEREGAHCFEPAVGCSVNNVDPIAEYGRALGQSVTGGYVYRGAAVPALQGIYVFGDFITGRIWGVPSDSQQGTVVTELLDTGINISSFAQSLDDEVFVIDYGGGGLYQIVAAP